MSAIGIKNREIIYDRDKGCLVCGTTTNLTIDHIVPLSKGGLNVLHNYQTLCEKHNLGKGSTIIDYRVTLLSDSRLSSVKLDSNSYFFYGYIIKKLSYGCPVGAKVYYNESQNSFLIGKKDKTVYSFSSLIDYIVTKEDYVKHYSTK
jgi:hypothetical protein